MDISFMDHDDDSAEFILQLQLEDIQQMTQCSKGKSREGEVSDAEVALNLFKQSLETCQEILADRRMTRSIANAVQNDGQVVSELFAEEERAVRDRDYALQLNGSTVRSRRLNEPIKEDIDDTILSKFAAIYVSDQITEDFFENPPKPTINQEATERGEPSSFSKNRRDHGPDHRCEACQELKPFFEVTAVPCGHEYCRDCLCQLFKASLDDESLFPPRCCRRLISPNSPGPKLFLGSDLMRKFEQTRIELNTPNRTYCCNPLCSAFIHPDNITGDRALCSDCGTAVCTHCKSPAHLGDCPQDSNLHRLLTLANENGWQRCQSCGRIVELDIGCNHMT
ncbi:MAG: hypothetical protein M1834_003027 [Cirrosporium novae-zelandiae]|nr:MAG: hypothetical protein M1834_003027 [Cirrosporium novae-zelandiae]